MLLTIIFLKLLLFNYTNSLTIKQGIYDYKTDYVIVLNNTNIQNIYNNNDKTWFIEFYSTYCGFCIRYSTLWKQIAKSLLPWKNIVSIGAIDCTDENNEKICQKYNIYAVPMLKFFSINTKPDDPGLNVKHHFSIDDTIDAITQLLIKEQLEGRSGKTWPNLSPYRDIDILSSWESLPADIQYQFIIFEKNDSLLGAQVILDFNELSIIKINRLIIQDNNSYNITQYPTIMVLSRNEEPRTLNFDTIIRRGVTETIREYLKEKNIDFTTKEPEKININEEKVNNKSLSSGSLILEKMDDRVYHSDLEATLRYSLKREIPFHENITGDKLIALNNYLDLLIKYFPSTSSANITKFLIVLKENTSTKTELNGTLFKKIINEAENQTSISGYLDSKKWIMCKNNKYPCGLWLMFHTLTVESAHNNTESLKVLSVIYDYVKNYFSCADCVKHFKEMSNRTKLFEQNNGDESILWLWRAHNEVNARLSVDDDKKIQYPSYESCPTCRESKYGSWIEAEVLKFLKTKYGITKHTFRANINNNNNDTSYANNNGVNTLLSILILVYNLLFN